MKQKLLRVCLAVVIALPMFTNVFAMSYEELSARLDGITEDIAAMKQEYEKVLNDYPEVINALSAESKDAALNLQDNLMAEDIEEKLEKIKEELSVSVVPDAAIVLDAIEDLEADAEKLIEDNKEIVDEVKGGYSDLTVDEVKQVVEQVKDIVVSLGAEIDVTDTYNKVLSILDDAHTKALAVNTKLEDIIAGNKATFKSALTKDLITELLSEVKAKDKEAIIDTLIETVNNANGGADLKADLKDVKADLAEIKDILLELNDVNEQDLLMFSDAQTEDVSEKLKEVEKDYVDFAKVIIDNYVEDYMDIAINLVYDESVDNMIDYANEALDYFAEYKDTIKDINASDVIDRIPEELAEKAGLLVALGFVNTDDYNKEYIETNFGTQIDNLTKYIAEEFVDYLDHIDTTINEEVTNTYKNGTNPNEIQTALRKITAARFNTLANLKSLKARVDTEVLANHEDIKEDVTKVANHVYGLYNENILASIEATMTKENDKSSRKYEYNNMDLYVLTNKFLATADFTAELGVPEENSDVLEYTELANSKIKTGSVLTITLSDIVIGNYAFAVLGDTFADGVINSRDYMVIKNWVMHGKDMTKITLIAADTFRDKEVNSRDYMVIKNYVMKNQEISL